MGIQHISGSEIREKIRAIDKEKEHKEADVLNGIADMGKGYIKDLNSADETVYEIQMDYGDCAEELEQISYDYNQAIKTQEELEDEIVAIKNRIEELETKVEKGEELTESESDELRNLYTSLSSREYDSDYTSKRSSDLYNDLGKTSRKLAGYDETLKDTVSAMDGYHDAGEEIQHAAKQYGEDVNSENKLKWNERQKWRNVFNVAVAVTTLDITAIATTQGMTAVAGDCITESGYDEYIDKNNLTKVSSQTFYSAENHEFTAKYDAVEEGGNKINGECTSATVKVESYGRTISDASNIVKLKAATAKDYKPDISDDV